MMALLENRAGAVFDMVLPYFAVRLAIQTRQQYLQLLKGIVLVAAPLGVVGLGECLTGWNPLGFLRVYRDPRGRDSLLHGGGEVRPHPRKRRVLALHHVWSVLCHAGARLCRAVAQHPGEGRVLVWPGAHGAGGLLLCVQRAGPRSRDWL